MWQCAACIPIIFTETNRTKEIIIIIIFQIVWLFNFRQVIFNYLIIYQLLIALFKIGNWSIIPSPNNELPFCSFWIQNGLCAINGCQDICKTVWDIKFWNPIEDMIQGGLFSLWVRFVFVQYWLGVQSKDRNFFKSVFKISSNITYLLL